MEGSRRYKEGKIYDKSVQAVYELVPWVDVNRNVIRVCDVRSSRRSHSVDVYRNGIPSLPLASTD